MKLFRSARMAGVPLLAVESADPEASIRSCTKELGKAEEIALFEWDCCRGLGALNKYSEGVQSDEELPADQTLNLPEFLGTLAAKSSKKGNKFAGSVLFIHMSNRTLGEYPVAQGIWNLRDVAKRNKQQMIVLMGPSIKLPMELKHDIVIVSEPLPDAEALIKIVNSTVSDINDETINKQVKKDMDKIVDTLRGLSAFAAEQVLSMSCSKSGINMDSLWDRKRKMIEQTPGLEVWRGGETFDDLGGLLNLKDFLTRVLTSGKTPVRAIGFVDEIEKGLAGAGGDTSGTSQDQLGVFLKVMQDESIPGIILIGPGGTGKSAIAKAAGNVAGAPVISIDTGAMKGSLVGESEAKIRAAFDVFKAVSQGKGMFIATCNKIASLPPELRRRFTLGTFFVDLPGDAERATIWSVWNKRYKIDEPITEEILYASRDWSGAEVKAACDVSFRTGLNLMQAMKYVVPVIKSAPEQVEALRQMANGRFISASAVGVYQYDKSRNQVQEGGRKVELE